LLPAHHWYFNYNIGFSLYIFAGISILMAGVKFNAIAYAEEDALADRSDTRATATSVDVVVFLAGLASDPQMISPILDDLRQITARLGAHERPDGKSQAMLSSIFLRLEDRLIHGEELRAYSPEDLHQMIEVKFKASVNEPQFWQGIKHANS
jgi:hypothetical protein